MKTTIVRKEDFDLILDKASMGLEWRATYSSGVHHHTTHFFRVCFDDWGFEEVRDIGTHHIDYYQDEEQHTFTVPTFLYEAYIK